jgi:hypothetical protein
MLLEAGVPTSAQAILSTIRATGIISKRLLPTGVHLLTHSDVPKWVSRFLQHMDRDKSAALLQAATQHGHAEFADMLREAGAALNDSLSGQEQQQQQQQ